VLAGEKQRMGRDYDFKKVIQWFAERADCIIVLFDAHKLDISDELRNVLNTLRPHQDKVKVLLNKADQVNSQQLMRVYGALMWQLGKVLNTPEVCRVYVGSFWDQPLVNTENAALLAREKEDLMNELSDLPRNAALRRINELVKRTRSVKVHAYIIHYLRKQMPYTFGKKGKLQSTCHHPPTVEHPPPFGPPQEKQQRLIGRLENEFVQCARRYNLPLGDFPNLDEFRTNLLQIKDISKFQKLDKSLVKEMDRVRPLSSSAERRLARSI